MVLPDGGGTAVAGGRRRRTGVGCERTPLVEQEVGVTGEDLARGHLLDLGVVKVVPVPVDGVLAVSLRGKEVIFR